MHHYDHLKSMLHAQGAVWQPLKEFWKADQHFSERDIDAVSKRIVHHL